MTNEYLITWVDGTTARITATMMGTLDDESGWLAFTNEEGTEPNYIVRADQVRSVETNPCS